MTSVTSSKSWVVFKSALKRFKWLGILYCVTMFLELPLFIWMELNKQKSLQGEFWAEFAKNYNPNILFNPLANFINLAVAVVFGLILFHYLQKDRESTFFHSLPIKRSFLYLQNLLAGLTLIWLPIIINGFLIYGVFKLFGISQVQWLTQYSIPMQEELMDIPSTINMWKVVAYWLYLSLLMTGLFYIFTVFIGMLTGNVLLQGALTFIGLFLPLGLYVLVKFNLGLMLYGLPKDVDNKIATWLSPIVNYLDTSYYQLPQQTLSWYLWYLVAAVIICGAGIYFYKKRQTEAAGETLAANWIRLLFKYGVTFCVALTGGVYFSSFNQNSVGILYSGYTIGAVLGYIISDMIAYKSFHFYKRWKGMAIFGAVFILLITSINLDILGVEKYVPDQKNIEEVYISIMNRDGYRPDEGLKEKENIQLVRQLHQQIIKMQDNNKAREIFIRQQQMNRVKATQYSSVAPMQQMPQLVSMDLAYTLSSGKKVKRTYAIDISQYRQFLYPLFNSTEAKKLMHGRLFKMNEGKIDEINIHNYHLNKNIRIYKPVELKEALDALRKDVLYVSYESVIENKVPSKAMIEFITETEYDRRLGFYNLNYYSEFKNFEAFLTRYGYLRELFMDPEEVSAIVIKKAGTEETVEIKDKNKISKLLDWCNIDDRKGFIVKQNATEIMYNTGFYGKIIKKDGSFLFVMLDGSNYVRETISQMFEVK